MLRRVATMMVAFHAIACSGGGGVIGPVGSGPSGSVDAGTPSTDPADGDQNPPGKDPSSESGNHPRCEQYLSCVLATRPSAYAAELALYGDGSECWNTAAQSASCEKACTKEFESIAGQCKCTGTNCKANTWTLSSGDYVATNVTDSSNDACQQAGRIMSLHYEILTKVDDASPAISLKFGDDQTEHSVHGTLDEDGRGSLTEPQPLSGSTWTVQITSAGFDKFDASFAASMEAVPPFYPACTSVIKASFKHR